MIRSAIALARPGISLAVGLSALAGYVLTAGELRGGAPLFAGTFALSAAVSVLNQIQERDRDARMQRTKVRPLASGAMSAGQGGVIFAALLTLCVLCLWPLLSWGVLPVLLLVLGLYNGLYTLMKPLTVHEREHENPAARRWSGAYSTPGRRSGCGSFWRLRPRTRQVFASPTFCIIWAASWPSAP
jgi:heme O synthase-like polyprenyltransferase